MVKAGQAIQTGQIIAQAGGVIIVAGGSLGLLLHLSGLDVLITVLFLFYAATREKRAAPYYFIRHLLRKKEEVVRAGVVSGELAVALDTVPLGKIIRTFTPQRFCFIFLLDERQRYRGMVSETAVIEAMLTKGVDFPVGCLLEQKKIILFDPLVLKVKHCNFCCLTDILQLTSIFWSECHGDYGDKEGKKHGRFF